MALYKLDFFTSKAGNQSSSDTFEANSLNDAIEQCRQQYPVFGRPTGAIVKADSPAKYAKSQGLKSMFVVSEMTGQSLQTLSNWYHNEKKRELFKVVIAGCFALQEAKKEES